MFSSMTMLTLKIIYSFIDLVIFNNIVPKYDNKAAYLVWSMVLPDRKERLFSL